MTDKYPGGIEVHGRVTPEYATILTPEALAFVAKLHREFEPRRQELLARASRARRSSTPGQLPDFLPETKPIREAEWKIADAAAATCSTAASRSPGRPTARW